ncbi:MAG TPA: DMT family transporter [Paracoccaceae bacterium]|nr:DMT family transporter [Paracoccaceae bacterium]
MGRADLARLFLLSLLWGGSFLFVALALRGLEPLTLVWLRVAGAAAVLGLVLWATGRAFPPRTAWPAMTVMGALNCAVPFVLITLAQRDLDAGLAAILNAMTPLFTVLVAALAGEERATLRRLAGVCLGLAGVAALIGGGAGAPAAQALCLAAALSYGLASVWGRRLPRMGLSATASAFGMLAAAAAILLPLVLAIDRPFARALPGAGPLLAVAALAVLCTALAYLLYFRLLADGGAVSLSPVTFLIPASALPLRVLFLVATPGRPAAAGLGLILAGLWCVLRAPPLPSPRPAG